jgi:integrase
MAASATFFTDQNTADPAALTIAARLPPSVLQALKTTPRASFGEGLPMPPPGTRMTRDELSFQLVQLHGRQVVTNCTFAQGAAPDTVAGLVERGANGAYGLRFSSIYNGVPGCTPYNGVPAFIDLADPQFDVTYVVPTTAWTQHHFGVVSRQLQSAQAQLSSLQQAHTQLQANASSLQASSIIPSNSSVVTLDPIAFVAAQQAAMPVDQVAKAKGWRKQTVERFTSGQGRTRPLAPEEKVDFRRRAPLEARREAGLLLALKELIEPSLTSQTLPVDPKLVGADRLIDARIRELHTRYVKEDPKRATALEENRIRDMWAELSGVVTETMLRNQAPAEYIEHADEHPPVPPHMPTAYALWETSPLVTKDTAAQRRRKTLECAKGAKTNLKGGRKPKCPKCGTAIDADGDCENALCSTHRDGAVRAPASAPRGHANPDGSCALNAALTAIAPFLKEDGHLITNAALHDRKKDRERLVTKLVDRKVNIQPNATCARECLEALTLVLPRDVSAKFGTSVVKTPHDGEHAAMTTLPQHAEAAIMYKGDKQNGHWICLVRHGKKVYCVNDDAVSEITTAPAGFVVAAVTFHQNNGAAVRKDIANFSEKNTPLGTTEPGITNHAPTVAAPITQCIATTKKGTQCGAHAVTNYNRCAVHLYARGSTAVCDHIRGGKKCSQWACIGFTKCAYHIIAHCNESGTPPPGPHQHQEDRPKPDESRRAIALSAAPPALVAQAQNEAQQSTTSDAFEAPAATQPVTDASPPVFQHGHRFPTPPVTGMKGADLVVLTTGIKDLATIPETAIHGITFDQRREHIKWLRLLHEMPHAFRNKPLAEAVLATMNYHANRGTRWRDTTWASRLGTVDGALQRLSMYTTSVVDLRLSFAPIWADALRQAARLNKVQIKNKAQPATLEEVKATIERLLRMDTPATTERATQLLLMWVTCARPGCTLQLKFEDVSIDNAVNGEITVIFRRGKRQEMGLSALPVHTILPMEWLPILQQKLTQVHPPDAFLWTFPSRQARELAVTRLTHDLRATHPRLESRSIRVGALVRMANNNVPESKMQEFSGHQSVEMLREYISYTNLVKHRAENMRGAATHLISGQPSAPAPLRGGTSRPSAPLWRTQKSSRSTPNL